MKKIKGVVTYKVEVEVEVPDNAECHDIEFECVWAADQNIKAGAAAASDISFEEVERG